MTETKTETPMMAGRQCGNEFTIYPIDNVHERISEPRTIVVTDEERLAYTDMMTATAEERDVVLWKWYRESVKDAAVNAVVELGEELDELADGPSR
jgi:hypothetical protein